MPQIDSKSTTMAPRTAFNWKLIIVCVSIFGMMYGLFSYNRTLKMLDDHRKRLVKISQKAEEAAAQLQVSAERKNDCLTQLKTMKAKLVKLQKNSDETEISVRQNQHEQGTKMRKVMLKVKEAEDKFSKLQEDYDALREKSQKQQTEYEELRKKDAAALKKLDQERLSEVQTLKDQIADLKRYKADNIRKHPERAKKHKKSKLGDGEDKKRLQVLAPQKSPLPIDSRLAQKRVLKPESINEKADNSPEKKDKAAEKTDETDDKDNTPVKKDNQAPDNITNAAVMKKKELSTKTTTTLKPPEPEDGQAADNAQVQPAQNQEQQQQQMEVPVPKAALANDNDNQLQVPVKKEEDKAKADNQVDQLVGGTGDEKPNANASDEEIAGM